LVQVHPYIYRAGTSFGPKAGTLVVLPGLSPLREAAFGSVVFPNREAYAWRYAPEGIKMSGADADSIEGIIRALEPQIRQLPEEVQEGLRVVCKDGAMSVELPLDGGVRGYVGYATATPERPIAVFLRVAEGATPVDITRAVNPTGSRFSLAAVHRQLQELTRPELGRTIGLKPSPVRDPGSAGGYPQTNETASRIAQPEWAGQARSAAETDFKAALSGAASCGAQVTATKTN
jgi:hypothetical protein